MSDIPLLTQSSDIKKMNSNEYTTSQEPDMYDLDAEQQSKQDQLNLLESLANSLLRKRDEAEIGRASCRERV